MRVTYLELFVFTIVALLTGWWCFAALDAWNANKIVSENVDLFMAAVITLVNASPHDTVATRYTILLKVKTLAEGLWNSCQGGCSPPQRLDKTCFYKFLVEAIRKSVPEEDVLFSDPKSWMETRWSTYLSSVDYSKDENLFSVVLACSAMFLLVVLVVSLCMSECECKKPPALAKTADAAPDTDADTSADQVIIVIKPQEATA